MNRLLCYLIFLLSPLPMFAVGTPKVSVGIDVLFNEGYHTLLQGKRIGLITNHTGVSSNLEATIDLLKRNAKTYGFTVTALFSPEHGIRGSSHAEKFIDHEVDPDGIPIYSLHGKGMRPTKKMLAEVDLLIYDIQDIGVRCYTYSTTLFFAMEEAAKHHIPVIVLDRPNPINGLTVDGPMVEDEWRSIIGYINVAFCHGMTIGELATFFNHEYHVGCELTVIPMRGWKRHMSFLETGLIWIPTSPHIPEASTVFFYPMTGMLGELQLLNIGVWYSLPFKVIGAPWIDAEMFARQLNAQNFPGVKFQPFHFRPFYGRFAHEECHGVLILVLDSKIYKPVSTQYLLLGMLKSLFPQKFREAIKVAEKRQLMFCRVNGTAEVERLIREEPYIVWKLKALHQRERDQFMIKRQKYLFPNYSIDG